MVRVVGRCVALFVPIGLGCNDASPVVGHDASGETASGGSIESTGGRDAGDQDGSGGVSTSEEGSELDASTQAGTSTSSGESTARDATEDGDPETGTEAGFKFDVGIDGDLGIDIPSGFPNTCAEAESLATSVGCVFYPLALPGTRDATGFMVSNMSSSVAHVTFSDKGGLIEQVEVQPGAMHMFTDQGEHQMDTIPYIGEDGYLIESDQVLQVFQFMPPEGTSSADASIVLPGPTLGVRHRVVTYNTHENSGFQYAAVVATEDDTEVTFTLAQPGSQTIAGEGLSALDFSMANDTLVVQLDRLDNVLIVGLWENDAGDLNEFTGSLVESNKPVAVYSGKDVTNVPEGYCCADLIATAVPPVGTYGTEYAGVRFLPIGQPGKYDIWRVIGNHDGTVIELTGDHQGTLMLDAGEFTDIATGDVFWASSNHPFGLVHFMTAGSLFPNSFTPPGCETLASPGDPAMGWVYPKGNWLNRYLFSPGTGTDSWCHDHVTIVAALEDWEEITMDGQPLPEPTPIGGASEHGYVYVPVPNPSHEIEAPPSVEVEVSVYGYVSHGSYFYPGGMGLRTLNPEG